MFCASRSAFADDAVTCRSTRKVSKIKLVDGAMLSIPSLEKYGVVEARSGHPRCQLPPGKSNQELVRATRKK